MRSNALRKEIDEEEVVERPPYLHVVESGELQAEEASPAFGEVAPFLFVAIAFCALLAVWSVLGIMNVVPPLPMPTGSFM